MNRSIKQKGLAVLDQQETTEYKQLIPEISHEMCYTIVAEQDNDFLSYAAIHMERWLKENPHLVEFMQKMIQQADEDSERMLKLAVIILRMVETSLEVKQLTEDLKGKLDGPPKELLLVQAKETTKEKTTKDQTPIIPFSKFTKEQNNGEANNREDSSDGRTTEEPEAGV
jgi:uncharacterized protein YigA (DUF484 family)